MKTLTHIVICLIILDFFLKCRSQPTIRNIFFLPGSNLVTTDQVQRDGLVIATLNTGENTTICNYRFDDIQAGVFCRTLGFPGQGVSILYSNPRYAGPVLISNVQCTGSESSIIYCSNSGRVDQGMPCNSHKIDVHVYCLMPKVPPIVTPITVNTICNKSSSIYTFTPSPGKRNIGFLRFNLNSNPYPVCNSDFSFNADSARIVCNELCSNVSDPSASMPFVHPLLQSLTSLTSVRLTCSGNSCTGTLRNCSSRSSLIGLQCGEDPIEIEKQPIVNCSNTNMNVSWPRAFVPPINPNLISLLPACSSSQMNTTTEDAIMSIQFSVCQPTILTDEKFINFTYVISRSYQPDGITMQPPKLLNVICSFDRNANPNNTLGLSPINTTLLNGTTTLPVEMTLYTDNRYTNQLLPLGLVNSDKQVYVKVAIKNPTKNVSLVLVNCTASTSNDFNFQNVTNSVYLIDASCPNPNYDVVISPFNRSEIRFRFTPFKITSTALNSLYVLCTTSLCYVNEETFCPYCLRTRRRRSIYLETNKDLASYEVGGFFQLSNKDL